jgi:hypothetical protein
VRGCHLLCKNKAAALVAGLACLGLFFYIPGRSHTPLPHYLSVPYNDSLADNPLVEPANDPPGNMALNAGPGATSVARVYADVNANMPRAYWDYDSVNI